VQLRIHDAPPGFLADAGAFLRTAEAENSAIMAQMGRMITAPGPDDMNPYLACAVDRSDVVAAAVHASSPTLQITAGPARAFALFASDLAARERQPKCMVGPLRSCEAFGQAWRERTGGAFELRFRLRHLALTATPTQLRIRGEMRHPVPAEYELIGDWLCAFMLEARMPAEEPARLRARFAQRMERGFIRVWFDDRVVSFAGFGEIRDDAGPGSARIGPVYTPLECRGCGYASALVSELSRELLQGGKRAVFLTTDLANPISNGIYEKIGYRRAAEHFHFDLTAAPADSAA
jgi:ribosomal protein S18 acetylase RimI-like enzyme